MTGPVTPSGTSAGGHAGLRNAPTRTSLIREQPGQYGWAIVDAETRIPIKVDGCPARGLTRWEARMTLGLLGIAYTEVPA